MEDRLKNNIRYVKGIGEAKGKLYAKLGIETVEDLLFYFPRAYENRGEPVVIRELSTGKSASFVAKTDRINEYRAKSGRLVTKVTAYDDTGSINITFFNNKYIKSTLKEGTDYLFYGLIEGTFVTKEVVSPVFEKYAPGGSFGIVPVYPLTGGLTQKQLAKDIRQAVAACLNGVTEYMPPGLLSTYSLMPLRDAISGIHFPRSFDECERAKARLCFDELFLLQLYLVGLKRRREGQKGVSMKREDDLSPFLQRLPYHLTGAQQKALSDIIGDLRSEVPANRLLQGDVGSGKTVVCAGGVYFAYRNRYQSALMAPTEILAEQHYANLAPLFLPLGIKTALLTASVPAKRKDEIKEGLKNGDIDFVIGTHAILSEDVEFNRLGLVVTDEQHRFGVAQRAALSGKGEGVNVIVMSATPIPRSLSLVIYGDLDLSVIDELPPGRQKVDTYLVGEDMRERIFQFIYKQLQSGAQGYVICPLVEESEKMDVRSVEEYAKGLPPYILKNFRTEIIHGRMKGEQKDRIMNDFKHKKTDLLISTTVIEVGIDVKNAAFMVVEDAQRFGLSQLHQLRGRVGRGEKKSYCILFCKDISEKTKERLEVFCRTNDGFEIAREDLRLRGPGDFLGQRQHGLPALKIADVFSDAQTVYQTREAAFSLLSEDPSLAAEENRYLKSKVAQIMEGNEKNIFN